ncbi:MAG TPA: hypothetical protein VNS09_13455 [Solirubrobacter sp.]|nr:hypothetical protein [Solirubrobacter sp.]
MAVLGETERQALESVDAGIAGMQRTVEHAAMADALDAEILTRLAATFKDIAGRVNETFPPEIDSPTLNELRWRMVKVLTQSFDAEPTLDDADAMLLELEAIRHIVRDLLDEQPPIELRDAAKVIALLQEWLPGVPQAQLAELLGQSTRTLQRLAHAERGKTASDRVQIVARLVAILRHGWTPRGVMMWFERPRRELGGRAPAELLDDAAREGDLIRIARAGRVQGAA